METIFGGFISNILGVYTRYYFLKLIRKEKTLEYLRGNSDDGSNNINQSFINTFIGLIVTIPLIIGIIKLMDILGIL